MRICSLASVATIVALLGSAASAQTVEDLVSRNLKSKGGVEKLRAVKAMRITGRISPAPGVEIPVTITSERPNKLRQESSIQGHQMITAFDGAKAWTVNPMMGSSAAQPLEGPQFDIIRDQADIDGPFVDSKTKGITLELLGTETVEGQQAHKLKVTRKSGQSQILFLSADTALELKAVNEIKQGDATLTVESVFSNYKPVEGITIAHTITQKISGPQTAQLNISVDKVEILPNLDDALFAMPASPKTP